MRPLARVVCLAALVLGLPAVAAGALAPPKWNVPDRLVVEATSPDGAVVTYTASATTNKNRSLQVSCSPRSGSRFRIGQTTVTCRVVSDDDDYEDEEKSFLVIVHDTTAPALTTPQSIQLQSTDGQPVPASDSRIAAFLAGASATDAVTERPTITNDAPSSFPVGTTTVMFRAVDAAGNARTGQATVTITAPPPGPPPPPVQPSPPPPPQPPVTPIEPAPPVDLEAPGAVTGARAATGNALVTLTWRLPAVLDLDRVEIVRSARTSPASVVYRGVASRFTDKAVRNGVAYTYAIRVLDLAGNVSAEVRLTARPQATRLVAPLHGVALSSPPVLRWSAVRGATYYNVQLWRNGRKILSRWPVRPSLPLTTRWSYGGRRHTLGAGTYTWYVWPGFGARSAARYGKLLGSRSFEIFAR